MHSSNEKMACRVCGLIQLDPPWGTDEKSPNYEICSCCGVEFGYEDSSKISVAAYRKKWLDKGAAWKYTAEKPESWNLEEQLNNVPFDFR